MSYYKGQVRTSSPAPIPTFGIVVDASCIPDSGSIKRDGFFHGRVEWQVFDIETRARVFASKTYKYGNINMGEFNAIVDAIYLLQAIGERTVPVYSDSLTAIAWFNNKKSGSKHPHNQLTEEISSTTKRALAWIKERQQGLNPVLFWNNATWGENPADYGRKRKGFAHNKWAPKGCTALSCTHPNCDCR